MTETVIKLTHPITIDGISIDKLPLRRPKVRDMLNVEKGTQSDAEKEINLFANLCELPPSTLHELDMSDYTQLQQAYQSFLS